MSLNSKQLKQLKRDYFCGGDLSYYSSDWQNALAAHRSGNYRNALKYYEQLDRSKLNLEFSELSKADEVLVRVKLGEPLDLKKTAHYQSKDAQLVFYYAQYTWAFWVDHKIAWSALWKMFFMSFSQPVPGVREMAYFLIGHMLAIGGRGFLGFSLAKWAHRKMTKLVMQQENITPWLDASGIVWAAFPYTLVVTGNLGKDFQEAIEVAESHLSHESYFVTLFQVSSLYGHAYTGDVVRTEVYSERMFGLHEKNQLLRYRPVTRIMPLLPYALRGFSRLIKDRYEAILVSHDPSISDPLINSQFYRIAALIALCLRESQRAKDLIKKASEFREKTKSFLIWQKFDDQILRYAERSEFFDPAVDDLVIGKNFKKSPPQVGDLYREAFRFLVESIALSESELEHKMARLVADQVGIEKYELIRDVRDRFNSQLRIRMGSVFIEFIDVPDNRRSLVGDLLGYLQPIVLDIFQMFHKLQRSQALEKEAEIGKLASQVAHDIRSPLAGLEMMVCSLSQVPDESRIMISKAVGRIRDIANNLLNRNRSISNPARGISSFIDASSKVDLIYPCIESTISEKLSQYRERDNISIELKAEGNIRGQFVNFNPSEFASILSNLVDNSVEAMHSDNHQVVISLFDSNASDSVEGFVSVVVEDTGSGFPVDILPRLGERGFSFGKKHGNGLGLANLVEKVSAWGGRYAFENSSKGARVTVQLQKGPSAEWMAQSLKISKNQEVIILDDDPSIHQLWEQRLPDDISRVHFYRAEDLFKYIDSSQNELGKSVYLIDYDLGEDLNGIQIIRRKNLYNDLCYLVTSHYDSSVVRSDIAALQIKLLPKFLTGFVPIQLT